MSGERTADGASASGPTGAPPLARAPIGEVRSPLGDAQTPASDAPPAEEASIQEQGRDPGVVFSVEDLVGSAVLTPNGARRGTVVDVFVGPPPEYRIQSLVVGASGWLHRLRVATRLPRRVRGATPIDEIPWDAVDRWDGLRIVLRPEAADEGVPES